MSDALRYRTLSSAEIERFWNEHWAGNFVVSRGHVTRPEDVESLALTGDGNDRLAVTTFGVRGDEAEIVTLNALVPGHRYGRTLLATVVRSSGSVAFGGFGS